MAAPQKWTTRCLAQLRLLLTAVKTQEDCLRYQQAQEIVFVIIHLLIKLALHSQRCHWKNLARKIILAPPCRRFLLFSRRMFTLPLGFLKLFSFILVCTFFRQKIFGLVSEEIFIEHVEIYRTKPVFDLWLFWLTCLHVRSVLAFCFFFHAFRVLSSVKSYLIRGLFSCFLLSQYSSVWKEPHCASSVVFLSLCPPPPPQRGFFV